MDKLKYIKLKNDDGSYTDSIPLSVDSDYVDVNGNTLTSELANKASNEKVNENIVNLQGQINSLASGSPLVANSISGMTNTSKIYVNTTDGKWYYYNGTNWSAGGIYQSSVNDNNFSFVSQNSLENKVISYNLSKFLNSGNVFFNKYVFENGSVNSVSEINTNQKYRIGAVNQIADRDFYIKITNPEFRIYIWTSHDGINSTGSGWITWESMPFKIECDTIYGLTIGKIVEDTSTVANIDEFINSICKTSFLEEFYFLPYLNKNDFTRGSANNIKTKNNQNNRVCAINLYSYNDISLVVKNNNFRIYVYKSNDGTLSNQQASGWITTSYNIEKGCKYAITIARVDENQDIADIETFLKSVVISNYGTNEIYEKIDNLAIPSEKSNFIWCSREGSLNCPPNSIYGVINSKKYGYSQMRVSVRKTSDNVFVLIHDEIINNEARNIDGTIINTTLNVADNNYDTLNQYDYGIKYGNQFKGLGLTKLDDFISYASKMGLDIVLEIKVGMTNQQVRHIHEVLSQHNFVKNVVWSSGLSVCNQVKSIIPYASLALIAHFEDTDVNTLLSLKNENNNVRIDSFDYDTYNIEKVIEFKTNNIDIKVGSAYNFQQILNFIDMGINIIEVANVRNPQKMLEEYVSSLI